MATDNSNTTLVDDVVVAALLTVVAALVGRELPGILFFLL